MGEPGGPGTSGTGEPGAAYSRELRALGSHSTEKLYHWGAGKTGQLQRQGTGSTRISTWHWGLLQGQALGVGTSTRPWWGVGWVRRGEGTRGPPVTASPAKGNTRAPYPVPIPGVDFKMKTIEVDGIKVRIQIW